MKQPNVSSFYTEQFNLEDNDLSEIRKMFNSLFKCNHEANEECILVFEKYATIPPKCLEIFSHILNVHELWLNRITNIQDGELKPWRRINKINFTLRNSDNYYITLGLLASESYGKNYAWLFNYVNHEGERVKINLSDTYFHILAHSAYHRGQIAYLLKQNSIPLADIQFATLKNVAQLY